MEPLFVFRAPPGERGKKDYYILPISDSQLKEEKRGRRGKRDRGKKEERSIANQPTRSLGWAGRAQRCWELRVRRGHPTPHTLLPDF